MAVYTETTKTGWGSRMGGSVKGAGVGVLLFLASFAVLFWNEGRAVKTHKALQEGAAAVTEAAPDRVDAALDGRLIHFTADVETDRELQDHWFGVQVRALRMERTVEMWQWRETSTSKTTDNWGGSQTTTTEYDYEKGWSDDLIDSSRFKVPEGHRNPAQFPVAGRKIMAGKVTAGAYRVPAKWVESMGSLEPAELPSVDTPLPDEAPKGMYRTAQGLYLPANPKPTEARDVVEIRTNRVELTLDDGRKAWTEEIETVTNRVEAVAATSEPLEPEIGDVRVRLFVALPGVTSFVVKQEPEGRLGAWQSSNGREIRMIRDGEASAAEMFEAAESGNRIITWLLRAGGYLMMSIGLSMVLGPLSMLVAVAPFLKKILGIGLGVVAWTASLALSLATIGVAWLTYRPLVGVPLLAGSVALLVWLKRRGAKGDAVAAKAD